MLSPYLEDLDLTEEEAYLTLPQLEADLHRETAFVWLLKWMGRLDEDLKGQILHGNPLENPAAIVWWQAKRQLIESLFDEIDQIRKPEDGNQGLQ